MTTWSQQQAIKPVSANNQARFTQVNKEVWDYDIKELLGLELWIKVTATPEDYTALLEGSSFEYCGETISHKGLNHVQAYLNFAAYIGESHLQDTFTGIVQKSRSDADFASAGALKNLQLRNKEIAYGYFEDVKKYISTLVICIKDKKISTSQLTGIRAI